MKKNGSKLMYILVFCTSFADALVAYSQSSYLNKYISLSSIGLLTTIATITTLLISIFYPKIILKINNYSTGLIILMLSMISSLLLFMAPNSAIIMIFFIIRYIAFVFIITNFDVILERFSKNENTGQIRTKYQTVINSAWLISPIITSKIIGGHNEYNLVYLLGLLFLIIASSIFLINKKQLDFKIKIKEYSIKETIKKIIKNKNLETIFSSSIVLNLFYCLMVLYMPIHLHNTIGLSWLCISIIFTVMLVPFVLIEIPAGIIADKYIGEKEMLIAGKIIIFLSVLAMFIIDSKSPIIWGFILFFSRVGAALVESMQETYFYKQVSEKDIDLINMFRQTKAFGWLLASLMAFLLLNFLPLVYVFILIAFIVLINTAFISASLKDTK